MNTMNTMNTNPMNTNPMNTLEEGFTVKLDSTNDIPVYQHIFKLPTNTVAYAMDDYLHDNYMTNSNYMSMSSNSNNIIINQLLSNDNNKNKTTYSNIFNLNTEIEKEISDLNMGLNAKNDKLINGLDKMRITDMANDYFFLQNLVNKNK